MITPHITEIAVNVADDVQMPKNDVTESEISDEIEAEQAED